MNDSPDNLQQPAAAIAAKPAEVTVVGAGPAGSTAALQLAAAGHSVLLLDREAFPRDKACGGGLLPGTQRALERLGVLARVKAAAQSFTAVTMISPGGIRMQVPGQYLVLRRRVLDRILAQAAVRAGAAFHQAEVTAITPQPDGSTELSIPGLPPIRSRIVLVATGARLRLLRPHGMVRDPRPAAVAAVAEVQSTAVVPTMTFSLTPAIRNGYAWIFPLGDGRYNIGCGTLFRRSKRDPGLQATFRLFAATFEPLRDILAQAAAPPRLRAAPLRCGLTAVEPKGPGNLLAVGEAIASTLPLSGEGIGKAVRTAEMAAALVDDALQTDDLARLSQFPVQLRQELLPVYRNYRRAQSMITLPWINDFMARRYQKSPYLQTCFAELMREETPPTDLFSVKAVIRSFLG